MERLVTASVVVGAYWAAVGVQLFSQQVTLVAEMNANALALWGFAPARSRDWSRDGNVLKPKAWKGR